MIWISKIDWDDTPLLNVIKLWNLYLQEIPLLREFKVPRFILPHGENHRHELHCFGDASERGYCGVIYLRSFVAERECQVQILTSRSKVAPIKKLSLPRLEVCASVLVTKLAFHVIQTFQDNLHISSVYYWSDSTIVLNWIKASPHKWKTFVGKSLLLLNINHHLNPGFMFPLP